jgi:hypothetical protein
MNLEEIHEEFAKLEWDIRITHARLANALTRRDFQTVNDMERRETVIRERILKLRKALAVLDAERLA